MAIRDSVTKVWDVAVAGEIFADHIFSGFERWPQPGEEHFSQDYTREVGGGAAITACALARFGRNVAIVAIAGEQDRWLHDRLRSFGVHLDGLRMSSTATAVSVSISTREDRSFLTWPGANVGMAQYLREPETWLRLTQARHVHFAMPIDREAATALFPQLRAAGCTLSLDLGHHPAWLRDPKSWATCGELDFFLPNEAEARIVVGTEDNSDGLLDGFAARGMPRVVLKRGRMGAAAMLDAERYAASAIPVEAVDTTGAGDAFDAGWIDAFLDRDQAGDQAWASDRDLVSAMLKRACICGSLSTRNSGALSALPNREELNQVYDQFK